MSYRNRFSLAFCAAIVTACADSESHIASVSPGEYAAQACWINRTGDLEAFLVLGMREDAVAVPYLISAKCLVGGRYTNVGEATLHHLNAVRLIDSQGKLTRILSHATVSKEVLSDQPLPSSGSIVYYLKARVAEVPGFPMRVYSPISVLKMAEGEMRFEQFLGLSRKERETLLRRLQKQ